MIKSKVFRVLFFIFFVAGTPFISWGSTITKEYCQTLIDSARKEYSQKNYTKSIEIFIKTKDFAEKNGWIDIKVKSLLGLGAICHRASDYKKALDYYMEAYKLVLNEPNMKTDEAKILSNIAGLYAIDDKYDMATDYYQKALLISRQIKDTTIMADLFNNLGIVANNLNNMNLAIQYADSISKLSQDIRFIIHAQQIKAQALYQKKEYNVAEKLALEAFRQVQVYESDYQPTISLILLITEIYQAQGREAEALLFIQNTLNYKPNLKEIIEIYEQMAILYQKNQLPDLALTYKDSVIILKDSFYVINAFIDIENSRIRIELLNSEKELSENKAKQKAERILLISILFFILILAIALVWIFRLKTIKNNQQKIIELEKEKSEKLLLAQQLKEQETLILLEQERSNNERNEKLILEQKLKEKETMTLLEQARLNNERNEKLILEQKLKEKETMTLLEQERFNSEIELKNSQLMAKTLFQSNRNKLIEEIIHMLSQISGYSRNPALGSIVRKLQMQLNNSEELEGFLSNFQQINPTIFSLLRSRHSDLSVDDIRLLSYIYLYSDMKKVASLLNISIEAAQKRKERLAIKMEVKTIDLYNYLLEIMHTSPFPAQ